MTFSIVPSIIYNEALDTYRITLDAITTGYWDYKLELYDSNHNLHDVLDYDEDPEITDVPMESTRKTYECADPLPVHIPGNPDAVVALNITVTDDPSTFAEAWITVELYDTEWPDEGVFYVNGSGPIDLPMTGDGNTQTFTVDIPVEWLVNGDNEFRFEYARSSSSWGYKVNALTLTVEYH